MSILALIILSIAITFTSVTYFRGKRPKKKTLLTFSAVIAGLWMLPLLISLGDNLGKREFRADHRLMAAIHFIESHKDEHARLPNEAELNAWEEQQVSIYFTLDSHPDENSPNYILTSWDGDQYQTYDSKNARFSTGL